MAARRVLIVDDMAHVRAELCTLLPLAGDIQIVGEAADGQEALRQAEALQPDVVLLDLEMPVMNGYQAAQQIKTNRPTCRVIALTIHDYPEAFERAAQCGVDAFLVKGAPLANLVQEILKKE